MLKRTLIVVVTLAASCWAQLPSRKYLDLAAVKTMVAAAEAEAQKRQVHVTICVVDDSGNLLFLERGDSVPVNTVDFARLKVTPHSTEVRPRMQRTRSRKGTLKRSHSPTFSRTRAVCRSL
jgi:glc operon protein GlcG